MAQSPEFKYAPMFQMGKDKTEYRLLTKEGISVSEFEGKEIVKVSPEALTLLAQQAFHDVEFMLRREHNLQVAKILRDPEATENDKYVALQFLFFLSVRILALPSSTVRRDSRYGLVLRMRRHSPAVCSTLTRRTTSAIHRTLH